MLLTLPNETFEAVEKLALADILIELALIKLPPVKSPPDPAPSVIAPVILALPAVTFPVTVKLPNVPTVVKLDVVMPDANVLPVKLAALAAIATFDAAVS